MRKKLENDSLSDSEPDDIGLSQHQQPGTGMDFVDGGHGGLAFEFGKPSGRNLMNLPMYLYDNYDNIDSSEDGRPFASNPMENPWQSGFDGYNIENMSDNEHNRKHNKSSNDTKSFKKAKARKIMNKLKIRRRNKKANGKKSKILRKIRKGNNNKNGNKKKKKQKPEKDPELKKPTKMECVTFSHIMRESVTLNWTPPEKDGFSMIQEFEIQFQMEIDGKLSGHWQMCYSDAPNKGCVYSLDGLLPGTVHHFRIRARNDVGYSKWSRKSHICTLGEAPPMDKTEQMDHKINKIKSNKQKKEEMEQNEKRKKRAKRRKKLRKKQMAKDAALAKEIEANEQMMKDKKQEMEDIDANLAQRMMYDELIRDREQEQLEDDIDLDQQHKIMAMIEAENEKRRKERKKPNYPSSSPANKNKKNKKVKNKKKTDKKSTNNNNQNNNRNKKKKAKPKFKVTPGVTLEDVRRENEEFQRKERIDSVLYMLFIFLVYNLCLYPLKFSDLICNFAIWSENVMLFYRYSEFVDGSY